MIRITLISLLLSLAGCATCGRHPTACRAVIIGASTAIIVGFSAAQWHSGGCIGCDTRQVPQVRTK